MNQTKNKNKYGKYKYLLPNYLKLIIINFAFFIESILLI